MASVNATLRWRVSGNDGYRQFPTRSQHPVGPHDLVTTVNLQISIFHKNGTFVSTQSLPSFLAPVGQAAFESMTDPKVLYDPYINRFWLLTTSFNDAAQRSTFLLAVSNTSDAAGSWSIFFFDASTAGYWCDFPQLGVDAQAVYLTCNMFSFPSTAPAFQYAKIQIMAKGQFLTGPCCAAWAFWNLWDSVWSHSFSFQPALMRGASAADGEFLVNADGGGGSGDELEVRHIATDNQSGVRNITFSTKGAVNISQQTIAGSTKKLFIILDGKTTITYFATDNWGNVETLKTVTVSLDMLPPIATASLSGQQNGGSTYIGPVQVTLNATDATSGVAATYYAIDVTNCKCWYHYISPFSVISSGQHTVYFYSVDIAGNVESTKSVSFSIFNPTITTLPGQSTGAATATLKGTVNLDGLSAGCASFAYTDGISVQFTTGQTISGSGSIPVSQPVGGLAPGAVYHVLLRLQGQACGNGGAWAKSNDQPFLMSENLK